MKFCPYLGLDLPDDEPFSDDHIVPYALGGTSELVVRVSKRANDILGHEVDSALVNNFLMGGERLKHDLRSHSGAEPEIAWRGEIDAGARAHAAEYRIRKKSVELITHPKVERRLLDGGQEQISIVAGSEREFLRIISDINRKRRKTGAIELDAQALLSQAERSTTDHPSMRVELCLDIGGIQRGFTKIALGCACLLLGDSYARSEGADLLRRVMWEPSAQARAEIPLRGSVFPVEPDAYFKRIMGIPDYHVLVVMPAGGSLAFSCSLFGRYFANIQLADNPVNYTVAAAGRVWVVNPATRRTTTLSYFDFIGSRFGA